MELDAFQCTVRGYKIFTPGTVQHVDEIIALRAERPNWRFHRFYTADGNGYFQRQDGGVDWVITRESENLLLRHLDDLIHIPHYPSDRERIRRPDNEAAYAARDAESTVVVDTTKLRLQGSDEDFNPWDIHRALLIRKSDSFVLVDGQYQEPNEEEWKVLERLGFTSDAFREFDSDTLETAVFVYNPGYVRERLSRDTDKKSIWSLSSLAPNYGHSTFNAGHTRLMSRDYFCGELSDTDTLVWSQLRRVDPEPQLGPWVLGAL